MGGVAQVTERTMGGTGRRTRVSTLEKASQPASGNSRRTWAATIIHDDDTSSPFIAELLDLLLGEYAG